MQQLSNLQNSISELQKALELIGAINFLNALIEKTSPFQLSDKRSSQQMRDRIMRHPFYQKVILLGIGVFGTCQCSEFTTIKKSVLKDFCDQVNNKISLLNIDYGYKNQILEKLYFGNFSQEQINNVQQYFQQQNRSVYTIKQQENIQNLVQMQKKFCAQKRNRNEDQLTNQQFYLKQRIDDENQFDKKIQKILIDKNIEQEQNEQNVLQLVDINSMPIEMNQILEVSFQNDLEKQTDYENQEKCQEQNEQNQFQQQNHNYDKKQNQEKQKYQIEYNETPKLQQQNLEIEQNDERNLLTDPNLNAYISPVNSFQNQKNNQSNQRYDLYPNYEILETNNNDNNRFKQEQNTQFSGHPPYSRLLRPLMDEFKGQFLKVQNLNPEQIAKADKKQEKQQYQSSKDIIKQQILEDYNFLNLVQYTNMISNQFQGKSTLQKQIACFILKIFKRYDIEVEYLAEMLNLDVKSLCQFLYNTEKGWFLQNVRKFKPQVEKLILRKVKHF